MVVLSVHDVSDGVHIASRTWWKSVRVDLFTLFDDGFQLGLVTTCDRPLQIGWKVCRDVFSCQFSCITLRSVSIRPLLSEDQH